MAQPTHAFDRLFMALDTSTPGDCCSQPDDSALDQVTQLCCRLLGTGIACVVLVDAERSWVKSLAGYDATQKANPALRTASRETTICSWCGHAVHLQLLAAFLRVLPCLPGRVPILVTDNPLCLSVVHCSFF